MRTRVANMYIVAGTFAIALACGGTSPAQTGRLDVNDISILWPVPKTVDDVKTLISANETLTDGITAIWPEDIFKRVIATAQTATVTGSGNDIGKIVFGANKTAFESAANWRIAGIRVDPSAPGCSDSLTRRFGSTPQIRLIVQPVTVNGTNVVVHDVTAHLVFDFILGTEPPIAPGFPRRATPDRARFLSVLQDLAAIKASLLAAGVTTDGDLSVHPGFTAHATTFSMQIATFLKKHLSAGRLNAVAFMGIDVGEPWVFFAMANRGGEFVRVGHPSLQTELGQMLTFRGGSHVMPQPVNATFGKGAGVSTASLFAPGVNLNSVAIMNAGQAGVPAVMLRDIPDIVANPEVSHFFNTDCLSCHSESTRRETLGLKDVVTPFHFQRAAGVSGVSREVLAKHPWNVRNFGWFPNRLERGTVVPSVALRTANEAAESAAFINRTYFGAEVEPGTSNTPLNAEIAPIPAAQPVANALTLVMTIKSANDRAQLKELIAKLQSLPPDKNPIAIALARLGNVHFARFVFIGDDKLAVITTYDDDFETYILSFVETIGDVFDQLLVHMKDAPPLPVRDNSEKFLEYVRKNDLTCEQPFFSAYPSLKVQDILTLQKKSVE